MQFAELFTVSSEWLVDNVISMASALLILVVGWLASRFAARSIRTMLARTKGVDKTIAPLLSQLARYGILILTVVVALGQVGVATTSFLAVLGAAGLAIALALQGTLSNIAAGVMLIWLRPLSVGEYIDGDGVSGTVMEIGLFATRLRSADGLYIFAPNSQIWDARIVNYSREPRRRFNLRIGIAYSSSIADARAVLLKIANEDERVLSTPPPVVHVEALGDSSVNMLLRLWVATPDYWGVLFAFHERAKLAFDEAGIEIPYNTIDLNLVNAPRLDIGPPGASAPRGKK